MQVDDLVQDVKDTHILTLQYEKKILKFIEDTRKIAMSFIGSKSKIKVAGYVVSRYRPWYLNENWNIFSIKLNRKTILSWYTKGARSSYGSWILDDFDLNNIENVKDFLYQLKSFMDIDLLEIKLNGLDAHTDKEFKELEELMS